MSAAVVGGRAAGIPAEMAAELERLFRDRPLGVLPDYSGDVVFWLADAGVPLEELTWEDVTSADRFNARRYPIVVYAGFEDYRQTLREEGDVDRGLVRYLEEGGLLLALPSGPFPFFYNERHTAVGSARRFGLSVSGGTGEPQRAPTGWERPPDDLTFTFDFHTDVMRSVPARAAFPQDGDLRWRPMTAEGLAEGDTYIPLARLTDQTGRYWGDGIAYVEHRETAPKNGKCLYAWMRMTDVAGCRHVLFDLLKLAASKAGE